MNVGGWLSVVIVFIDFSIHAFLKPSAYESLLHNPFTILDDLAQAEYYVAALSNQVPMHCSLLMENYLKDLWANARRLTKHKLRKVVTKQDIMSVLYKRAEYHGAALSNQVPIL
ncbi:hypothetical protein CEXT_610201 [Caerostris extrusa]|uniref:Uncharacterized protein n=1 Tax=Caerostris extrusa TaxID=172846 RepID=A0AAV4Y213_CAEEX|nr:hypothetical protein CEXT_610201 [Caerostris extrusa]